MIEPCAPETLQMAERAIGETFEGIAFAQVLERERLDRPPTPAGSAAFIDLVPPAEVRFLVMMDNAHLDACFRAAYPEIEEVPAAVRADFLAELTNTAAGHFMSLACPEREDMQIGLPVAATAEDLTEALRPSAERAVLRYRIEEHDLFLSLAPCG